MSRRLDALYAMAGQDESPEERDIAVAKLETMGAWPPPPRRPTAVGALPSPRSNWWSESSSGSGSTVSATFTWFVSQSGTER